MLGIIAKSKKQIYYTLNKAQVRLTNNKIYPLNILFSIFLISLGSADSHKKIFHAFRTSYCLNYKQC
jgi:hypothetical protein